MPARAFPTGACPPRLKRLRALPAARLPLRCPLPTGILLPSLLPHCAQAPSLSPFFENLKSTRRLALCAEANALLRHRIASQLPDALQSSQRFTRRSVKFIRWLRMFLFLPVPWERMPAVLRQLYATP